MKLSHTPISPFSYIPRICPCLSYPHPTPTPLPAQYSEQEIAIAMTYVYTSLTSYASSALTLFAMFLGFVLSSSAGVLLTYCLYPTTPRGSTERNSTVVCLLLTLFLGLSCGWRFLSLFLPRALPSRRRNFPHGRERYVAFGFLLFWTLTSSSLFSSLGTVGVYALPGVGSRAGVEAGWIFVLLLVWVGAGCWRFGAGQWTLGGV
jgi:hypothetical protein